MKISENGLHLLGFFKAKNYGLAVYAAPREMLDWFGGDAIACEQAQAELAEAGLLDLTDLPPRYIAFRVRGAGLVVDGVRYLQTLGETAT